MGKCLWLALGVLSAAVAQGQSADDVRHGLETALKGKQLPIRGFLGEPVIRYAWKTGHIEAVPEKISALGIFQTESIKVHEANGSVKGVTLRGVRRTLLKADMNAPGALSKADSRVSFEIDVRGADAATLSGLVPLLFYPDATSALNDVPPEIVLNLPMFQKSSDNQRSDFENQLIKSSDSWVKVPDPHEFKPAKVIFAPEPEFSEEARRSKVSGDVKLSLSVTDRGVVDAVWVLEPAGFGFDEQAIWAAAQYRFEPAKYAGKAVGVRLMIDINFQVF